MCSIQVDRLTSTEKAEKIAANLFVPPLLESLTGFKDEGKIEEETTEEPPKSLELKKQSNEGVKEVTLAIKNQDQPYCESFRVGSEGTFSGYGSIENL